MATPERLKYRTAPPWRSARALVDTGDEVGHAVNASERPRQSRRKEPVGVGDATYDTSSLAVPPVSGEETRRAPGEGCSRTRGLGRPRVALVADSRAYSSVTAPPPRARACPARACSPCGRGTRDSAATGGGT